MARINSNSFNNEELQYLKDELKKREHIISILRKSYDELLKINAKNEKIIRFVTNELSTTTRYLSHAAEPQ